MSSTSELALPPPDGGRRRGRLPRKDRRDYRPEYDQTAFGMCLLGATQADLARILGVTERTIQNWEKHIPNFRAACERGRKPADAAVMASLYRRTQPYEVTVKRIQWVKGVRHEVTETTHVPADPRAMELWLKLRKPWMGELAEVPNAPPPPPGDTDENPVDEIMGRLEGIRDRIIEHRQNDEATGVVRSRPSDDEPEDDGMTVEHDPRDRPRFNPEADDPEMEP